MKGGDSVADNQSARARLLVLMDILKVYSNESNVLSAEEICSHLEEYGYKTTKRNVIADIKCINTTPYKIIYVTKPKKGYYLVRNYTLSSADALMTAVYSSEMLTEAERNNARKTLSRIMSVPTNDLLMSTTEKVSVEIPREPCSWENTMSLRHAIYQKKKAEITFSVTEPGDGFDLPEKEESMTVNPVKIAISAYTSLLVFTLSGEKDARCMHLCRIKKVEILNEPAEEFTGNIEDAAGFFSGTVIKNRHRVAKWVFLKLRNEHAEFVRNYFGSPVQFRKADEEGYLIAKVFAVVDERFIGWLLCFGDIIELIAPTAVRDFIKEKLKNNILSE